jgi:hypothetical protein
MECAALEVPSDSWKFKPPQYFPFRPRDSAIGHKLRHLFIRVAFRHAGVWQGVDSTSRPVELALPVEANEVLPRKADGLDVSGPNDPVLADILHNFLERLAHRVSQCVIT